MNPFRNRSAASAAALAATLGAIPATAEPNCMAITAAALEIQATDCSQVWPQLQDSRQFPDVFAGAGKMLPLCYVSTKSASATIGSTPVTITSTLSGWTSDFFPILFPGGTDHLGTVVTQLTIADVRGNSVGKLFTRDTIDLSQIATGSAPEEDVIVGGTGPLQNAKGTYRIASMPEDPFAQKVKLTNLSGIVCIDGQ